MSDERKANSVFDELLKNAIDKTNGEVIYANTFGLSVSENEVILELYFTLPNMPHREPNRAVLLQRVALPLKLSGQLAHILAESLSKVEQTDRSPVNFSDSD